METRMLWKFRMRLARIRNMIVRRRRSSISANLVEGFEQRFRIRCRDPVLEDTGRRESDALAHGHLIAVRREQVEQRVVAHGHGVHDERVPFPMPRGIPRERRIVERSL